ncbi:MAG: hypothetical protein IKZ82_05360 [Clostridia bacterium]|nr:hypothetical protein [Clostridia bacterium]
MGILSFIYMMAFAACGILIAREVFSRDDTVKRVTFGLALGLLMLIWLPTLFAFVLSFNLAAQLLALAAAIAIAGFFMLRSLKRRKSGAFEPYKRTGKEKLVPMLLTVVPITLILFVLHINHTIVDASNGSLHVGQCTYGDLCMHLGFISSISVQQTFPPEYSLLPGTPLGYPFLCDSVSSTFYTLGASLRLSALLPALYACLVVTLGVYCLFDTWFKRTKTSVIATYMFFIGGGLGFAYIFNNKLLLEAEGVNRLKEMMEGFYKAPTNLPAEGLRWVNAIADMLVPQRATLFGWALLFPALTLLYRAAIEKENRLFIPLGIFAGAMPLVHTHSFVALGIISAYLFVTACFERIVERRPGENSRLLVKIMGAFLIMLILGALRMLDLVENPAGVAAKMTSIAVIAIGCIALIILAVEFIKASKEKKPVTLIALLMALTAAVSIISAFAANKKSVLFVIAPLIGLAVTFALAWTQKAEDGAKGDEAEIKNGRRQMLYFILFGVIAVVLAAPQLFGFTFKQSADSASFLRWNFNWDNESDGWLWFYIKNLGLIFILMPIAFILIKKEHRRFYAGSLVIWAVCEILLFQPNPYDNNKLLFVWFALTCGIVSELIASKLAERAYKEGAAPDESGRRTVDVQRTAARYLLCAFVLIAIMLSGVMTLAREYVSGDHYDITADENGKKRLALVESGYEVVSADLVEMTEWVKENTEKDAVFLTHNNHNNAIAMLTGRNIFCGSGTFLHWHGVDYGSRQKLISGMYSDPANNLRRYAEEYGIDYVLISSYERGNYSVDTDWFNANLEKVYSGRGVTLFKIGR